MLRGRCEFEVSTEPDVGDVLADPVDLERILWNLVINARDAQPSDGRVSITTERVTVVSNGVGVNHARITIRDDGVGMTSESATRLFEPFYTTKGGAGTGLGLAVVLDIVDGLDGILTVDTRQGVGTRIRIHLPSLE